MSRFVVFALVPALVAVLLVPVLSGARVKSDDSSRPAKAAATKAKRGPRGKTGAKGPTGPQGPQGATGTQGAQGPAGPVNVKYVEGATVANPATTQSYASADCPAGQKVIGGGVVSSSETVGEQRVNSSYPDDGPSGTNNRWSAFVDNTSGTAYSITAFAICTTPTSVS